jgi:hypothetical protein
MSERLDEKIGRQKQRERLIVRDSDKKAYLQQEKEQTKSYCV